MTKEDALQVIERYRGAYNHFKLTGAITFTHNQKLELSQARKTLTGNSTNISCSNCVMEMFIELYSNCGFEYDEEPKQRVLKLVTWNPDPVRLEELRLYGEELKNDKTNQEGQALGGTPEQPTEVQQRERSEDRRQKRSRKKGIG